jgi:hypothetical protein
MIYIKKNNTNAIYLTLSEIVSISNPNFLFKFEYDSYTEQNAIYYSSPDISLSKKRYNKFILVDDSVNGSTSSTQSYIGFTSSINLKPGQWSYTIYVTNQNIDVYNLVGVTYSQNIIETGRMFVDGVDTSIDFRYN